MEITNEDLTSALRKTNERILAGGDPTQDAVSRETIASWVAQEGPRILYASRGLPDSAPLMSILVVGIVAGIEYQKAQQ